MRRVVPLVAVVIFSTVALVGASDSVLTVPGERVVVIYPGDVVVQAGDIAHLGTYKIEGSATGEITIEQVELNADGEVISVLKDNSQAYLTIGKAGSTCYRSFSYTNPSTYTFSDMCDSTTGHGTTRYLDVTGQWAKFDDQCAWYLTDLPTVRNDVGNSFNASMSDYWALDIDNCSGNSCYFGPTNDIHFALELTLTTEEWFVIFVDFYGQYGRAGCSFGP